jgi:tetratricopeptide (TPR) repeat protein
LAYEHYLRGRQLQHTPAVANAERTRALFQRAIEIDPNYAPAYAGLAMLYAWWYEWWGGGEVAAKAADEASRRALELAPQLAESHVARGTALAQHNEYEVAGQEFEAAIRLNPNSFEAHHLYGRMCFANGATERSVELFRRGAEIQPEDFQCPILLAQSLRVLGHEAAAVAANRDGIRRAERWLELEPNSVRALSLGASALMDDGQAERALEWSARALAIAPDDASSTLNAACVYAKLGKKEEALSCLERCFGRGFGKRDWIEHDPDFEILRDDPRFEALLRKLA